MAKKLQLIIEKAKNKQMSARIHYGEDLLTTTGASIEEVIRSMKEQLEGFYQLDPSKVSFDIVYDIEAFFEQFDWINISDLARRCGINRVLLQQYKSGDKNPSEKQLQKIVDALHEMGTELINVKAVAA
jgi:transcriptional regulator with XRE-family HTH domain